MKKTLAKMFSDSLEKKAISYSDEIDGERKTILGSPKLPKELKK